MIGGIRTWGANGALELDENSFTVRIVYSSLVAPGGGRSVDISIPEVNTSNYSAVCVPVSDYSTDAQNPSAIGFIPVVNNGFVRVFFGHPDGSGPIGTTQQRLLVMRYR